MSAFNYREEGEKSERDLHEMRSRLRMLESMQGQGGVGTYAANGGLCLKCAQNEAILPPSVAVLHKQSMDCLTR